MDYQQQDRRHLLPPTSGSNIGEPTLPSVGPGYPSSLLRPFEISPRPQNQSDRGNLDPYSALSQWNMPGSFGSAVGASQPSAMPSLGPNSEEYNKSGDVSMEDCTWDGESVQVLSVGALDRLRSATGVPASFASFGISSFGAEQEDQASVFGTVPSDSYPVQSVHPLASEHLYAEAQPSTEGYAGGPHQATQSDSTQAHQAHYGEPSTNMVEVPSYWHQFQDPGEIPNYSTSSITIVHPCPINLAVAAHIAQVIAWDPQPSPGEATPTNRNLSPPLPESPPEAPQLPNLTRSHLSPRLFQAYPGTHPPSVSGSHVPPTSVHCTRSTLAPNLPPVLGLYGSPAYGPYIQNLGAASPPPRGFTGPRPRNSNPRASPKVRRTSTTLSTANRQPQVQDKPDALQAKLPSDQNRGHRRTVSSGWDLHSTGASQRVEPTDRTEAHSAMFRVIRVKEELGGNPGYQSRRYSASMNDLSDWLALPNSTTSSHATFIDPRTGQLLTVKITICRALGWQFVVLNVLYFRAFYFQMIEIPSDRFPPSLPKDDIIDGGLVLMITSWINTMLAMRVCAGNAPTTADVMLFTQTCLQSLEVTILISIAAQIDLTDFTVDEIEELGWEKMFETNPKTVEYYKRRVADRVEENILQFHLDGVLGNLRVALTNMHEPRICPDFASLWGSPYKIVEAALEATSLSSNLHLILSNPSEHKWVDHHTRHNLYTVQEGTDIAAETTVKVHQMIKDGEPLDQEYVRMFRNILMDQGSCSAIGYFARTVPLALVRTYQEGANPWLDSAFTKKFPYIGLLPFVAGTINAAFCSLQDFGCATSAEKIIGSSDLEVVYARKAECVKAFLDHICSTDAAESHMKDLKWIDTVARKEALTAIRSLDEHRQVWKRGRAEFLVWGPLIPWLTRDTGFKQDFLSLYEMLGSKPAPTEEGEVVDGYFPESPLTKYYDAVAAEFKEKLRAAQDAENKEKTLEGRRSDGDPIPDEILGRSVIFNMSHITEDTAGPAWPMIKMGLKRAHRILTKEKEEFERVLKGSHASQNTAEGA